MNHRQDKRYPLLLDAKIVTFDDETTAIKICDISVGGMGLTSPSHSLQVNQVVQIKVSVAGHLPQQYLLKGIIVHSGDNRIGSMFMKNYAAEVYHLLLASRRNSNGDQAGIIEEQPRPATEKRVVGM